MRMLSTDRIQNSAVFKRFFIRNDRSWEGGDRDVPIHTTRDQGNAVMLDPRSPMIFLITGAPSRRVLSHHALDV